MPITFYFPKNNALLLDFSLLLIFNKIIKIILDKKIFMKNVKK